MTEALVPLTGELVTVPDLGLARQPDLVLAEAQQAAVALQRVLAAKPRKVMLNGEQYLEFEDWQTCARFYGVSVMVVSTAPLELDGVRGYEARTVALLVSNGREISAADAMCLNDEPNWQKKPLFQLRSMAQTRACAKALRNVLAWVVVLAGFRPTPAEELTGQETAHAPNGRAPARPPVPTPRPGEPLRVTAVTMKEGETHGKPWTFYIVAFSDGREARTFDVPTAQLAETLRDDGRGCEVVLEPHPKQQGKLTIVELHAVALTAEENADAAHIF